MLFADARPGSDHERIAVVQDLASGLRAITVLHSTARGPAFGGIRRRAYASEAEAVEEAMALAGAMTLKCALAGLPAGGGKTVVFDHPGMERGPAYRALGDAVERLGGDYVCGPDVGTGEAELAEVRARTRWVNPLGNDAGVATAAGVLAGLRGVATHLFGSPELAGRRFALEGLGSVGLHLATTLLDVGATVAGWDIAEAAREVAARRGVSLLPTEQLWRADVDILVPCALGGCVTPTRARELRARAICGSANNQLASPEVGDLLAARGVAFAPDFLVSVGAVAEGVWSMSGSPSWRERYAATIAEVERRTREVLGAADRSGSSALRVATELARQALREPP